MRRVLIVLLFGMASQLTLGQQAPDAMLMAGRLLEWLPTSVSDYQLSGNPYSNVLLNKNKPYAVASKKYSNSGSELMIFIADYKGHDIPGQQIETWAAGKPFDDNERVGGSVQVAGYPGWSSSTKGRRSAILYVVAKDRYLITLTLSEGEIDLLMQVAQGLDFEKLP